MKKVIILSTISITLVFSSGYRIPESSINSMALSAAYVANAHGADSSYYNPANMVFNENRSSMEASLTYINLSKINYTDNRSSAYNSSSKSENFFIPTLFFSSKDYNNFRYGFSIVVPGGLSKRWDDTFAKTFAEEFTLEVIELNPVVAYKVKENFSIGGGIRVIYSKGIVKSDGVVYPPSTVGKRDMDGDAIEFGYNLAATFKPKNNITLSATYRSNIELKEEGNAKLYLNGSKMYDGDASVKVQLPAVASLALSYDFDKTTVEFEYDRTFWSSYKELNFEYANALPHPVLTAAFDDAKPKNWKDSDAFRVGITHKLNTLITLMGAVAYDKNPVPDDTINFELPDSDAYLFSGGLNYKYSNDLEFGASFLYDSKKSRDVKTDNLDGVFKDASAYLLTAGVRYKF